MVRPRSILVAAVIAVMPVGEALAVPPPPLAPQASANAHDLITALTRGDPLAYGALLDPDVHVFDNGKQVASNGPEWLSQFSRQMQHADISILTQAVTSDQVLTVETVSTIGKAMLACGGPPKGCVVDCCFWARTGSYRLGPNGKIIEIQFLTSTSYWGTPEHPLFGRLQPSQ